MKSADLVLLTLDASTGLTDEDHALIARSQGTRTLVVLNKIDVESGERLLHGLPEQLQQEVCPISALTGMGIDSLREWIRQSVQGSESPGFELVTVTNLRHLAMIHAAQEALANATHSAADRMPGDFVSIDVRGALDALGQITGQTVDDAVVHRIFQDFCVGK